MTWLDLADNENETFGWPSKGAFEPGRTGREWVSLLTVKEERGHASYLEAFTEHGDLTTRSNIPESAFAFPRQRKEPLTDASHVRNALARFDQVQGVSDADRDLAFANFKAAANYFGVDVREKNWRELGG
jgi:hypothetical protein